MGKVNCPSTVRVLFSLMTTVDALDVPVIIINKNRVIFIVVGIYWFIGFSVLREFFNASLESPNLTRHYN